MNRAIKLLEKALKNERELLSCCLAEIKRDNDAGLLGTFGQLELDYAGLMANCTEQVRVLEGTTMRIVPSQKPGEPSPTSVTDEMTPSSRER